ncbi:MAG: nuclear transport factor 2 family protein [Thermoanaerobaculia bacterium]
MNNGDTQAVLTKLFDAFSRRDGAVMASLYAPGAQFEDPIFKLQGEEIGRMWVALTSRSKDLSISYTVGQAAAGRGVVEWTARYLFGGKRPVVNVILSEFELADGLITKQTDRWDFPRWAAQALGAPGSLFGSFAWFRKKVSRDAATRIGLPPKP